MKIVVLAGGISTERDVSFVSGKNVYEALKSKGHQVVLADVYLGIEELPENVFEAEVDWTTQIGVVSEKCPDIEAVKAMRKDGGKSFFGPNVLPLCQTADVVFVALHGENGENGKIQAALDLMGIRYTCTDHVSSAICMDKAITKDIFRLGMSNFIMQGTNCLVQIVCNSTLQSYGGDVYVGIMTVANSVREIFMLPVSGIISGAQPVISYNYGAKAYGRVKDGIRFNTLIGCVYTMFAWLLVIIFPAFWFQIFSDDVQMLESGIMALKIYFFGFVFMAFQFAGQSTFQALGDAKHAVFFSLLRKAIIVAPLTVLLPIMGFGVNGVFLAEPISNIIGGTASYVTMRLTIYKELEQMS